MPTPISTIYSRKFQPYTPPNEGAGLVTFDRDICWRLNPRGLVTNAVVGAACWASNHFRLTEQQHQCLLDGLGLEQHRLPDGATILRPQARYRPGTASTATAPFDLTNPQMPLHHYDAVEVFGCIEGDDCIQRFETNEHPEGTQPQFWSVALHLDIGGHIEIVADFPKESQASTFGLILTDLIRTARQAKGLDTSKLYVT
ncbi:MAG: hypothetical protein HYX42_08145 [Polaromonas sp.]|uniref:hypothetical protein n=1 Tax=Polaromonas sp. TaxID=1869339 RepID=UPI0025EB6B3C|nr:hypothetical protein [Polaromonas sp.]MBI2726205.1 hypothetical protein [Polaromonas sp.]